MESVEIPAWQIENEGYEVGHIIYLTTLTASDEESYYLESYDEDTENYIAIRVTIQ